MAKVNSGAGGKIVLNVELNTKELKSKVKEMIGGFEDVETAILKTNKQLTKLTSKDTKGGLLDLLKQIAIATRENGRISERILAAERRGNLAVVAAIGTKTKAQINAAKTSEKISVIEAQQKSKLAQIEAKKLAQMELIDKKAKEHHGARKKELTEQEKAINALKGSSNSLLSHFEKGIIVANQFAELMRKIQQFGELLVKPVMEAGQFEQWQVALTNLTGSAEAADTKFREMIQFAKVTPFTIPGIIETGMRLEALGRYSLNTIRNLGDLAAASGKDVTQAVEAYSNLVTGRTGIAVKQFRALLISNADWIRETGKQVLKNVGGVKATTQEILDALPRILAKKNFIGLMDEQSKTFLGRLTNLEDSIQTFLARVGENFLNTSKNIVVGLTNIFNAFTLKAQDIGKGIETGGMVLLSGAVVSLASVIIKSGALIIAFFKNIAIAGALASFANMPLTAIAAIIAGMAALVGGYAYYRASLVETNKELLEFNEAERSRLSQDYEKQEAMQKTIKYQQELVESYKKLNRETNLNVTEAKEFKRVSDELAGLMPQLTDEYELTGTKEEKLTRLTNKLSEAFNNTSNNVIQLQNELSNINVEIAKYKFLDFADTVKDKMVSVYDEIYIAKVRAFEDEKYNVRKGAMGGFLAGTVRDINVGEAQISNLIGLKGFTMPTNLEDLRSEIIAEGLSGTGQKNNIRSKKAAVDRIINSYIENTVSGAEKAAYVKLKGLFAQITESSLHQLDVMTDPNIFSKFQKEVLTQITNMSEEQKVKFLSKIKSDILSKGGLDQSLFKEKGKIKVGEKTFDFLYKGDYTASEKWLSDLENSAEQSVAEQKTQDSQMGKEHDAALRKFIERNRDLFKIITVGYDKAAKAIENTDGKTPEERAKENEKEIVAANNQLNKLLADVTSNKTFADAPDTKVFIEIIEKEIETNKKTLDDIVNAVFGKMIERMEEQGTSFDDLMDYVMTEFNAAGGPGANTAAMKDVVLKQYRLKQNKFMQLMMAAEAKGLTRAELDVQSVDFTTPKGVEAGKSLIRNTFSTGRAGLGSAEMFSDIIKSSVGASYDKEIADAQKISDDVKRKEAITGFEVAKQNTIAELLQSLLDVMKNKLLPLMGGNGEYTAEELAMSSAVDPMTGLSVREGAKIKREKATIGITKDLKSAENKATEETNKGIESTKEADFKAWQDRLQYANQALGQLTDAYNTFYDNARQKITEEVEAWKKAQQDKLDLEQKRALSYARTSKQRERVDEIYAKKKEDLEKEANKKKAEQMKVWFEWDKAIKIAQTTMATAQAIMNIWATMAGPVAWVMSGVVGALGLTQIAAIAAQEMPEGGFEVGGFTGAGDNKQKAGTVHKNEFVLNAKATRKNRPLLEAMNDGDFSVADMLARGKNDLLGVTAPLSVRRDFMIVNELKRNDNNLIQELRALKEVFIQYAETPVVIGDDAARQITGLGIKKIRKFAMS